MKVGLVSMLQAAARHEAQEATRSAKRVGYQTVALYTTAVMCLTGFVFVLIGLASALSTQLGTGAGYAIAGAVALAIAALSWPLFSRMIDQRCGTRAGA